MSNGMGRSASQNVQFVPPGTLECFVSWIQQPCCVKSFLLMTPLGHAPRHTHARISWPFSCNRYHDSSSIPKQVNFGPIFALVNTCGWLKSETVVKCMVCVSLPDQSPWCDPTCTLHSLIDLLNGIDRPAWNIQHFWRAEPVVQHTKCIACFTGRMVVQYMQ